MKHCVLQARLAQIRSTQVAVDELTVAQIGVLQSSAIELAAHKSGISQVSAAQIDFAKIKALQTEVLQRLTCSVQCQQPLTGQTAVFRKRENGGELDSISRQRLSLLGGATVVVLAMAYVLPVRTAGAVTCSCSEVPLRPREGSTECSAAGT